MTHYLLPKLKGKRIIILDPWRTIIGRKTDEILEESKVISPKRVVALGKANERMIRRADVVLAVLDGVDVDSGVAAEIGFAYGIGKRIIGYRGDFRLTGESTTAMVNLQVATFIRESGGQIHTSLRRLLKALTVE